MADTKLVAAEVQERALRLLRLLGDAAAANLLAACTLEVVVDEIGDVALTVVGPLVTHAGPLDLEQPMARALAQVLREALGEVLPAGVWIERLLARPGSPVEPPPVVQGITASRTTPMTTVMPGGDMPGLNQAIGELAPRMWSGIRFRSESELRIAQALDRAGVLFVPGALARLGLRGARQNREADFLVCAEGVWGILEVDGAPFHPDAQRDLDAARDHLFAQHGIGIIHHVDAARCFATPDAVVVEFLAMLHTTKWSQREGASG